MKSGVKNAIFQQNFAEQKYKVKKKEKMPQKNTSKST